MVVHQIVDRSGGRITPTSKTSIPDGDSAEMSQPRTKPATLHTSFGSHCLTPLLFTPSSEVATTPKTAKKFGTMNEDKRSRKQGHCSPAAGPSFGRRESPGHLANQAAADGPPKASGGASPRTAVSDGEAPLGVGKDAADPESLQKCDLAVGQIWRPLPEAHGRAHGSQQQAIFAPFRPTCCAHLAVVVGGAT